MGRDGLEPPIAFAAGFTARCINQFYAPTQKCSRNLPITCTLSFKGEFNVTDKKVARSFLNERACIAITKIKSQQKKINHRKKAFAHR